MAVKHEAWSDVRAEWLEVGFNHLPHEVKTFIETMDILAGATSAPEGSHLVFWWDKGEVVTKSWASPSAILYRLTCTSIPLSGKV